MVCASPKSDSHSNDPTKGRLPDVNNNNDDDDDGDGDDDILEEFEVTKEFNDKIMALYTSMFQHHDENELNSLFLSIQAVILMCKWFSIHVAIFFSY